MEDPRIISALFIFLKMAYYNVLINTEVKVFVKIEIKIRVKGCFSSKFAFSIFIISTLVPHWIAAIEVIAYIVRYICNNQLCWLNSIFFIILHRISV